MEYYPVLTGESSIKLTIQSNQTWHSGSLNNAINDLHNYFGFTMQLSVDGSALSHNSEKFNLSEMLTDYNLLEEIAFQYTTADEGFYIHQLSVDSYFIEDVLHYLHRCRCHDYSFHRYYLHSHVLSFPSLHFLLRTYSKLSYDNFKVWA